MNILLLWEPQETGRENDIICSRGVKDAASVVLGPLMIWMVENDIMQKSREIKVMYYVKRS